MASTLWTKYPERQVLVQGAGLVMLQYWNCWPRIQPVAVFNPVGLSFTGIRK